MRIWASTFKDWMKANFTHKELKDIATNGVVGGTFSGLDNYIDTTHLYNKFHRELWAIVISDAWSYGYKNPYSFLGHLHPEYVDGVVDDETHKNFIVWYCAESVARQIVGG